jgi:hypothetical protein
MTITIGPTTFENVFYDAGVDVLYLHVGDPSTAAGLRRVARWPRAALRR